jgi:hypothetical protein
MQGRDEPVWNSDWIAAADLRSAIDAGKIIDQTALESLSEIVPVEKYRSSLSNLNMSHKSSTSR